jgi:hypothetical protein
MLCIYCHTDGRNNLALSMQASVNIRRYTYCMTDYVFVDVVIICIIRRCAMVTDCIWGYCTRIIVADLPRSSVPNNGIIQGVRFIQARGIYEWWLVVILSVHRGDSPSVILLYELLIVAACIKLLAYSCSYIAAHVVYCSNVAYLQL